MPCPRARRPAQVNFSAEDEKNEVEMAILLDIARGYPLYIIYINTTLYTATILIKKLLKKLCENIVFAGISGCACAIVPIGSRFDSRLG